MLRHAASNPSKRQALVGELEAIEFEELKNKLLSRNTGGVGFRWFPENVSGGKGSFQGARNGLGISATCSDEADIPKCRRPAVDGEEENNNPPLKKHPCS